MAIHRFLTIRMRKEHKDRIVKDAELKGYENVSEYIRSITLNDELSMQQKITEIYNILTGKDNNIKPKILEKPLTTYFKKK